MDANAKKTALRMIPYGLYVLTAADKSGSRVAAAAVNWVTQASFEPPLVVVGVKVDSHAHPLIKETKAFALNVLGKGQQALAFTFFKPAELKGDTISGEKFRAGVTGAPILASTPAFVECTLEAHVKAGVLPAAYAVSSDPERPVPVFVQPEKIGILVAGDPGRNQSKGYVNNHIQGGRVSKRI